MERDENYVPYTRSSFNLPEEESATQSDYEEILGETPFVIMTRMLVMQFLYVLWTYIICDWLLTDCDKWLVGVFIVSLSLITFSLYTDLLYLYRKNTMGSPSYPPGTNHFNPSSPLFKPRQREYVFLIRSHPLQS